VLASDGQWIRDGAVYFTKQLGTNMLRFLKLLDPWETREGSGLDVGQQQRRAREVFPVYVQRSRLHYWRPGLELHPGLRLLIGLAATFSLRDLRLADVINDALCRRRDGWVDVFNIEGDCQSGEDLESYFPGIEPGAAMAPPILGVWRDGSLKELLNGHHARARALELVGSPMSAEEVVRGLSPPSQEMLQEG
jgi:hypothetical protein